MASPMASPMASSFRAKDNTISPRVAALSSRTANNQPLKRQRTSPQPKTSTTRSEATTQHSLRPYLPKRRARRANSLYDVVAGRLMAYSYQKELPHNSYAAKHDSLPHAHTPIGPTEALSARHHAPNFVKEDHLYNMHRLLPDQTFKSFAGKSLVHLSGVRCDSLPNSDLLKAVHAYSSDFYAATTKDKGRCDWRSLDETALLAVGILMEEEISKLLGENGWSVFVEEDDYTPDENSMDTDVGEISSESLSEGAAGEDD